MEAWPFSGGGRPEVCVTRGWSAENHLEPWFPAPTGRPSQEEEETARWCLLDPLCTLAPLRSSLLFSLFFSFIPLLPISIPPILSFPIIFLEVPPGLCVSGPHSFPSPHIASLGKPPFANNIFGLVLSLCPHSPRASLSSPGPCSEVPQASAPPPHPSPSGLSFLLTDGRAVSTPSLKQHLIAVFCSWTSKLGLRHCAGVAVVWALGERR